MATYREDAQALVRVILAREPGTRPQVRKRWFRRSWYVRMVRHGVVCEYEDQNHYWLERTFVGTFGRDRK